MAFVPEGRVTSFVRKHTVSTRTRAFISVVGVLGGAVMFFRYLQPDHELATSQERYAMRGGNASPNAQTDQGTVNSSPRRF